MANGQSFRDLLVWREAMSLVEDVYRATQSFPTEERYGLSSQLRRAAVSIPSNIAEGSQRKYAKVFVHFLRIALGSRAEVAVQIEIAKRLNLVSVAEHQMLAQRTDAVGRMLNGLISALERPRPPNHQPMCNREDR
ncbi:MAG: four helix bundle protein [Vicinamibacterales bacterium]